ncbi:hypothetical protein BS47DRAFT_1488730 [Hydnum rufescens UP504]|uniref:Uncharacterized protein n=1 Tax=Hydnum rufescens UP504 TaxID=1448309 RepID=A0A9P6AKY8_9AGAM|nr:hypothetical protein BS47DRAFT_1488730 [Hydnum rufescens UP504]
MPSNLRPAVRLVLHASGWNPRTIWFVAELATLATIFQYCRACGGPFSPLAQSADIIVNIHALWIYSDRFPAVAQPTSVNYFLMATKSRKIYGEVENLRSSSRAQCSAVRVPRRPGFRPFQPLAWGARANTVLMLNLTVGDLGLFFSTLATCLATHIQMSLLGFPRVRNDRYSEIFIGTFITNANSTVNGSI